MPPRLSSHFGTWRDPVVRIEVLYDLAYVLVIVLLLGLLWLRWARGSVAGDTHAVGFSVTAILGIVLSIAFAIPVIPIPTGTFFRMVWPGAFPSFLGGLLGAAPGLIGVYALWRIRADLTGGGSS